MEVSGVGGGNSYRKEAKWHEIVYTGCDIHKHQSVAIPYMQYNWW